MDQQQVEHAQVGRRLEPGDVAAVRHRAVEQREQRRVVVELDHAREGRLAREHDRRRVRRERADRRAERPAVEPPLAARARAASANPATAATITAGVASRAVVAHAVASCAISASTANPHGHDERPRQAQAGDALEQQPAAERQHRQHRREHEPGDDQCAHRLLLAVPGLPGRAATRRERPRRFARGSAGRRATGRRPRPAPSRRGRRGGRWSRCSWRRPRSGPSAASASPRPSPRRRPSSRRRRRRPGTWRSSGTAPCRRRRRPSGR